MDHQIEQMRRDWDARAKADAKYYIACQCQEQADAEFDAGAPEIVARVRRDFAHLPQSPPAERRFLEIGCGVGRLMRPLAADCGEIHGVDISPEMVAQGRERLARIPYAHLHVAWNNDLSAFAGASFDLVYSYAVFQHIPESALIFHYVAESFRVLKPGGIFVAQFNSAPPDATAGDTWIGTWIPEELLLGYAREHSWQVLSCEGVNTQYLWLTMKKPATPLGASAETASATIRTVYRPSGAATLHAGGPDGFANAKILDLPEDCCDLNDLSVSIDTHSIPIRYIGPVLPGDEREISAQIPETISPGPALLALCWKGRKVSNLVDVMVEKRPPLEPRIVRISDGKDLLREDDISSGVMQIGLSGCEDPGTLHVAVGDFAIHRPHAFCVEPLQGFYLVSIDIPANVRGEQAVCVSVDGQSLPPHPVTIH